MEIEGDRETEQLLTIINERQLSLLLSQGSITWRAGESQSTINLTIGTPPVMQRLESCDVREESYDSDHLSILTTLLLNALEATPIMHRQWGRIDKEAFEKGLTAKLPRPLTEMGESEQMEQQIQAITEALQHTIQETVPLVCMSKWSKPGFRPEVEGGHTGGQ